MALTWAGILGYCQRNPIEVKRVASELIELSTRQHFAYWLALGTTFHGWARSACGDFVGGLASIEEGVAYFQATGLRGGVGMGLKAEALHLAGRTADALAAVVEAEALVERQGERWWFAELLRLRGVYLAALGADDARIEAVLRAAVSAAREQHSISLTRRAEATLAQYQSEKARAD